MSRTTHLRIYTLRPETDVREWARRFNDDIKPLREMHGFRVEGLWITAPPPRGLTHGAGAGGGIPWVTERDKKFVYTVSYDGPEADWEPKNDIYYGSPEVAAAGARTNGAITGRDLWFVSSADDRD